jgi:hypothetical protein
MVTFKLEVSHGRGSSLHSLLLLVLWVQSIPLKFEITRSTHLNCDRQGSSHSRRPCARDLDINYKYSNYLRRSNCKLDGALI